MYDKAKVQTLLNAIVTRTLPAFIKLSSKKFFFLGGHFSFFAMKRKCEGEWWYEEHAKCAKFKQQKALEEEYVKGSQALCNKAYCVNFSQRLVWNFKQKFCVRPLCWRPFDTSSKNAVQKFIQRNASKKSKVRWTRNLPPDHFQKIAAHRKRLLFHGTKSLQNAKSILANGFDPNLRKRQMFGRGEYFSHRFDVAKHYGKYVIVAEVANAKFTASHFISSQAKNAYPRAVLLV